MKNPLRFNDEMLLSRTLGRRRLVLALIALVFVSCSIVGAASPVRASIPGATATTCARLSGFIYGITATVSKCSVANTGRTGTFPIDLLSTDSGTITWASGQTTALSLATGTQVVPSACHLRAPEYRIAGEITADTTGSIILGSNVSALICISKSGKMSLERHSVLSL